LTASVTSLDIITLDSSAANAPTPAPTMANLAPGTNTKCSFYFTGDKYQSIPAGTTFATVCHFAAFMSGSTIDEIITLNPCKSN
jgi:hypothetical protein